MLPRINNFSKANSATAVMNERREELTRRLIQIDKLEDIPDYREYAKEFGIDYDTAYRDMVACMQKVPVEQVSMTQFKISKIFDNTIAEAKTLMNSEDPEIKAKGIKLLLEAQEKLTTFMERFKLKEKVADKVQVESRSIVINISGLEEYPDFTPKEDNDTNESETIDIEL